MNLYRAIYLFHLININLTVQRHTDFKPYLMDS